MGNSSYSTTSRSTRLSKTYAAGKNGPAGVVGTTGEDFIKKMLDTTDHASSSYVFKEVFKSSNMHQSMTPFGVRREARDSVNHPKVIPIIFGLDVTGSMGDLPKHLIAGELPSLMQKTIDSGLDPAIMFCGIGDHECDRAPFQIGQFESGDAELDHWLTTTWLEGNGGGNAGESYQLAWIYALTKVDTDFEKKHNRKPYIITCGDEPVLKRTPLATLKKLFGEGEYPAKNDVVDTVELYEKLKERFEPFHIHINHGGHRDTNLETIMGDRCVVINDFKNVIPTIINFLVEQESKHGSIEKVQQDSSAPVQEQKFNLGDNIF
jgi:hypothetical protein